MTDREYEEFQKFRKRKHRRHRRKVFWITLLIVILIGAGVLRAAGYLNRDSAESAASLFYKAAETVTAPVRHKAAEVVTDQILDNAADEAAQQISETSGGAVSVEEAKQQIQQTIDSMPEEDQQALTGIVESHMDSSTVADITQYLANGDTAGAMQYAQEHLSPEEQQQAQELINKYLAGQSTESQ